MLTLPQAPVAEKLFPDASTSGPSVLFKEGIDDRIDPDRREPDFFRDLNLDQLAARLSLGREEQNLAAFLWHWPVDLETIRYRQDVFRDIAVDTTRAAILRFLTDMKAVDAGMAALADLRDAHQRGRVKLDVIGRYAAALDQFALALTALPLRSSGLNRIRAYILDQVASLTFKADQTRAAEIVQALDNVSYLVLVEGDRVSVRLTEDEDWIGPNLDAFFLHHGAWKPPRARFRFRDRLELDSIESVVLGFVAALKPDLFEALHAFVETSHHYRDPVVLVFAREIQLYLGYDELIADVRRRGLTFCYPDLVEEADVELHDMFDLILADMMQRTDGQPVVNDAAFRGPERIHVVSGPNQGGKTTYARTIGQIHYLANLGFPVPGTSARVRAITRLATHFDEEEVAASEQGKLQSDLLRIRAMLRGATRDTLFVLNEIFSSTTAADASWLARRILEKIEELDALCVCVTFMTELADLSSATVSVVSVTEGSSSDRRPFKLARRKADGQAYAVDLAARYGLTYAPLRARIS